MVAMEDGDAFERIECGACCVPRLRQRLVATQEPVLTRNLMIDAANCGETENLLKCSRCHNVWFCGVQCQKVSWCHMVFHF